MKPTRHGKTKLSIITYIQIVFFLLVATGGMLSFFGNTGLNNVAQEFERLSHQALPVAMNNTVIVRGSLETAQHLAEVINSRSVEELESAYQQLLTDESTVTGSLHELAALADRDDIDWLKQDTSQFIREMKQIEIASSNLYDSQQQILVTKEKIESDKATMNYAVSAVRAEMSRLGMEVYGQHPEGVNHVTNFVNHSLEMASNLIALLVETDHAKAEKLVHALRGSNLAGMNYAWRELNRIDSTISDYTSITIPFEMVGALFAEQGLVESQLHTLLLMQEQALKVEEVRGQIASIMSQLNTLTAGADAMIKQGGQGVMVASDSARSLFVTLSIAGLVLAVAASWWISHTVRASLKKIDRVVKATSQGDLTAQSNQVMHPRSLLYWASCLMSRIAITAHTLGRLVDNSHSLGTASESSQQAASQSRIALKQQSDELATVATAISQLESSIKEIVSQHYGSLKPKLKKPTNWPCKASTLLNAVPSGCDHLTSSLRSMSSECQNLIAT